MIKSTNCKPDLDYFFSISGPEPQRTVFENKILSDLDKIPGKTVITLGKPEANKSIINKGNITIYSHLKRTQQQEYMNRAKLVITRSGYTTMMELAELGKKALLIPTNGQPEQEYLCNYHSEVGNYHHVKLENLDLPKDLNVAKSYSGFKSPYNTEKCVEKFLEIISIGNK